jgi:polyhydroxyalkanoate synthesis regulator phasin
MNSIKMVNPYNMDLKQIRTPKQLDDAFKAMNADAYTKLMEDTLLAGGLNVDQALKRSKDRLLEAKQKHLTTPSKQIEELNKLILDAYVFQINSLDECRDLMRA